MDRKYKVCYDYKKRTKGGILDAMFLVSVFVIGFIWIMLLIIVNK